MMPLTLPATPHIAKRTIHIALTDKAIVAMDTTSIKSNRAISRAWLYAGMLF